jgi:nucleotide-binding universal stress UspA family protein
MSSFPPKDAVQPYVVVAGADDGPDGRRVIEAAAVAMANRMAGQLHILHLSPASELRSEATLALLEHGRASVDAVAAAIREPTRPRVFVHIRSGLPWREIVDEARRTTADLIVVGTHGRTGTARLLLGSQGEEVLRHAPCPVLVVRDAYPDPDANQAPEVEPPCPDCARIQDDSDGEQQWCPKHAEHHVKAHLHYELPAGYGAGSWLSRP